jgi:IS1 family transposase
MNTLPMKTKLPILAAMIEGNSIRSTERMTGVHRDTIVRLVTRTGDACAQFLDAHIQRIVAERIQVDEIWTYVFKKQARIAAHENIAGIGDQYVFVAMDADSKLVISHFIGKRDGDSAYCLMADLKERLLYPAQITTDGFRPYIPAVRNTFGDDVDYAQLVKIYGQPQAAASSRDWYSPIQVIGAVPVAVSGRPKMRAVSTSYIERQNLTIRMQMRRFTRLTNGFSKKLENLKAAVALHFAYYNFVRVHQTLRVTPAMAAQVTDHLWTLGELLEASKAA